MKEESTDKNRKLSELEDSKEHMPPSFSGCTEVVRSTYGNATPENLPIYMGKHPTKGVLVSLGKNNPYCTDEYTLHYIIGALTELAAQLKVGKPTDSTVIHYEDGFKQPSKVVNKESEELEALIKDTIVNKLKDAGYPVPKGAVKTKGDVPPGMTKEDAIKMAEDEAAKYIADPRNKEGFDALDKLKGMLKGLGAKLPKELKDQLPEDIKEELEEQSAEEKKENAFKEDVKGMIDKMTPEEKEEFLKNQVKEARDEMFENLKKFESELLGEIEVEEDVKYDYDYYKKVFDKGKLPALREELAKIPKEERQAIINKIVEEHSKRQTT